MDLSVVIPVHNEAQNLEPLIGEVHRALKTSYDFELP